MDLNQDIELKGFRRSDRNTKYHCWSCTASSLDISGNVDVGGTLELRAITIDGVSPETISDIVEMMVSSNTETGNSVVTTIVIPHLILLLEL